MGAVKRAGALPTKKSGINKKEHLHRSRRPRSRPARPGDRDFFGELLREREHCLRKRAKKTKKEHSHRDHEDHEATQPCLKDIDECWWSLDETAAVACTNASPAETMLSPYVSLRGVLCRGNLLTLYLRNL